MSHLPKKPDCKRKEEEEEEEGLFKANAVNEEEEEEEGLFKGGGGGENSLFKADV